MPPRTTLYPKKTKSPKHSSIASPLHWKYKVNHLSSCQLCFFLQTINLILTAQETRRYRQVVVEIIDDEKSFFKKGKEVTTDVLKITINCC